MFHEKHVATGMIELADEIAEYDRVVAGKGDQGRRPRGGRRFGPNITGLSGIVVTNSLKERCRINYYEIVERCGDCHDSAAHQLVVQCYRY
jgi:hypothetical protein